MRGSWRRFDFWLLGATLLLVVFGVAMVYSATLGVPTYETYPLRQVIYAGIGLLLLLAAATFDYRLLTSLQWPIYGIILAVLLLVAV
ncbi:MAG: rod shape-determining protein RodA, partial [Clostridiales bacterium]|nr:rod shape-determining protein RodA [Clostridiales bacterium]